MRVQFCVFLAIVATVTVMACATLSNFRPCAEQVAKDQVPDVIDSAKFCDGDRNCMERELKAQAWTVAGKMAQCKSNELSATAVDAGQVKD